MDENDITAWLGKPPAVVASQERTITSSSATGPSRSSSRRSNSSSDPLHDASAVSEAEYRSRKEITTSSHSNSPGEGERKSLAHDNQRRSRIRINLPILGRNESKAYTYLPGHFTASKVLSEAKDGIFVVKLRSGEVEKFSVHQLYGLTNGSNSLQEFQKTTRHSRQRLTRTQDPLANIDWDGFLLSEDGSEPESLENRRKKPKLAEEEDSDVSEAEPAEDDEDDFSDESQVLTRRSSRLVRTKRNSRQDGRNAERKQRGARRSERNRVMPRRSMREKQEHEISSASEDEVGPKFVTLKERFTKLSDDDPFRKRHRQDCDTCGYGGDNNLQKGPLIFCQGCTNSYHKVCLGPRGSRDHLVTKVGDEFFVLQCRRCVGIAYSKDSIAPHLGRCSKCLELGTVSAPFRDRLTTRQEQLQREENDGVDPITSVRPALLNNISNVMFRCATCQRPWHMHHLPERKTVQTRLADDDADEGDAKDESILSTENVAQRRFDLYHRSWLCKDCVENQHPIDTIVAWRPVSVDEYVPGTPIDHVRETSKEYLIKWRGQSYLRVQWMPGAWVWSVAASASRVAFLKKSSLPKMTTTDAIPEDYFRVDIVFDVRYTSVVRNSSKEIDLVRAKEVDSAYIKYKGLGYEDAIWEKPPAFSDTGRWQDFKSAYDDYVTKVYMGIPSQSTLRRHLIHVRSNDFNKIARQTQPTTVTGGQLMTYQLEGLNWLYWQWFRNHNAILADEMGLGKTIQLIAFFATLIQEHKCWPFLVVVPNSTCPNWRREIKKWAPALRVVSYYGSERARKLTSEFELFPKDKDNDNDEDVKVNKKRAEIKDIKAHIVLASYESVVEEKTRKSLLRVPWQGLIVDEGQRLKNEKNLVYECLSKIHFPFKVLLTGTPLQNNVRELFNLLQFLDKNLKTTELEEKYADLNQENISELHELLKPYFLRRTKVQVLKFLPPMAQIIIPLSMSTVQKKVYKSILSDNPHLMKSIFSRESSLANKDRINLNNVLMLLRKTLCHPFVYNREVEQRTDDPEAAHRGLVEASAKLQLLSIMLPKLRERGHRVLLFSQFLDNLDIMEDFLDGLGMLHRRLDGTISALEKQKRIDEFNAPNSEYFAFLLSTRAGGVGINLATADTVIILDPDFNPHQDIQALSRAHRIGQQNKVLVFQLMTKASAEEKIMAIGKKKMALDHVLIERMDQEEATGDDLESILKFGAHALFEDQNDENQVIYDSASVDKLLDRSQIESTKSSDNQSAESQFSFARVWANDKSTFEDGIQDPEEYTPNHDIWDKILEEREKAYQEELARKVETLGRGKRKRGLVDYKAKRVNEQDNRDVGPGDKSASDYESEPSSSSSSEAAEQPSPPRTTRVRPFRRVKIPTGTAPHFNGQGPTEYIPMGGLPPIHKCTACYENHPLGWCRLKIAGVEHCGLCGLAHVGHGRTCPHLNDERQVDVLLATLKQSTEAREMVEEAQKYLRLIRSHLVSQRRAKEKENESARPHSMPVHALPPTSHQPQFYHPHQTQQPLQPYPSYPPHRPHPPHQQYQNYQSYQRQGPHQGSSQRPPPGPTQTTNNNGKVSHYSNSQPPSIVNTSIANAKADVELAATLQRAIANMSKGVGDAVSNMNANANANTRNK